MDLTFEQVHEKFYRLIHFMSNKFTPKTFYTRDDFYQDGEMILYDCWTKYKDKPFEEFKTIFSTSLRRLLISKFKAAKRDMSTTVSCDLFVTDTNTDRSESSRQIALEARLDENLSNVYIQESLTQLRDLLKDNIIALTILNEMLDPSERTLWELKMDKARRKMVHNQGQEGIRTLENTTKVRMHHIASSLEISLNDLNKALKEIREQAEYVFEE